MKTIILLSLAVLSLNVFAQQPISGFVFEDSNGNGSRDTNEPGVPGVAISDQASVVVTNSQGQFQIPARKGFGIVMMSVPTGYSAVGSFWRKLAPAESRSDFALKKVSAPVEFSFVHASDTHVSEKSLDRMSKFRTAVEKANPSFVLITGDLVRDALRVPEAEATRLYELFKAETASIRPPVWCAPGNHEIFGIERHLSLVSATHPLYGRNIYRHYLGPDYYSFNYGGIHFIALNSLEFDDLYYYGRVDSLQLEWMKQDVAAISKSTPIVTFQHVPFYSGGLSMEPYTEDGPGRTLETGKGGKQLRHVVSNAQDVFKILQGYNYPLALAGHYHFQQKFMMEGVPTRFEQTAAVIGGVNDGVFKMPSGVTIYRVKDGKIDQGTFVRLDE
jgi:hypothetical protein